MSIFPRLIAILLAAAVFVSAQQKVNKFENAQQRAHDASKIVTMFAVLPTSEFPKELVDRAQAVGVFPSVKKATALFTSMTDGYGVISARTETGWTMPAFYEFSGGGYGGGPFSPTETSAIVLLFMTKDALGWFEKGGVKLRGDKKAIEGPIGALSDAQRKEIEGADILAYAFREGKLSGKSFGKSFWKTFLLNPDNNINSPLYGMKGREVLAGKEIKPATPIPASISEFAEALQKNYGPAKPPVSSSN